MLSTHWILLDIIFFLYQSKKKRVKDDNFDAGWNICNQNLMAFINIASGFQHFPSNSIYYTYE